MLPLIASAFSLVRVNCIVAEFPTPITSKSNSSTSKLKCGSATVQSEKEAISSTTIERGSVEEAVVCPV